MTSWIGLLPLVATATTGTVSTATTATCGRVEVVCHRESGPSVEGIVEERGVVVATDGDLGLSFRFGGLANLAFDGNTRVVQNFPITQVGLKIVSSRSFHIPLAFGLSYRDITSGGGRDDSVVGLDFTAGAQWYFRMWERIAPFAGVTVGIGYTDIAGDALIGFGIGPVLGVEYYVADRVSLGAQYAFTFQVAHLADDDDTLLTLSTSAGGQAFITLYF